MNQTACSPVLRVARLAAVGLVAAGTTAVAAAADFRGFVSDGPAGLLVFQPCHGAAPGRQVFRVSDKTPDAALTAGAAAVRQVMEDASRPLYVEFVGEASGNAFTVRRFQRAIGHVLACSSSPRDIVAGASLQASGADTGWRFVATAAGAQLDLAPGRSVRFPAEAFKPTKSGGTQVFDAWSSRDGGTIRVEVTERLCLEEGTETAYGARVALRYGSTAVEGCAARF